MNEYIKPNYETISIKQMRDLMELMNSSLLNAFSEQDYYDILSVFRRVIERLEKIENEVRANEKTIDNKQKQW